MAVAAYAYVTSLLHVFDQVQHPVRRRLLPNTKQIETFHEKKIYIIDSHVVVQLCQEHEDETDMCLPLLFSEDTNDDGLCEASENKMDMDLSSSFCQNIDKVTEKIDSIKEELLTMVKAEGKAAQEQQPPIVSNTRVVGFDEHLARVMDELTRHQPELQIIPIMGMGGIGKITLTQFAFQNKCVVEKFDVRVWFTISQEYSADEILLGILIDIGISGDLKSETLAELGLRLRKYLFGRRYLIVMDNLWSTQGWDDFKLSFPNDVNGSRVMVTTRLTDVAISLGSHNPYLMNFLDENKSWNLLLEKVFTKESCSPELEKIGKRIAKSCRGLPLAIVVIGGLLAKSNMIREYWESVVGKVNLLVTSENDDECSKILSLSYNHLPIHLKPRFLYMSFFPEDCEIKVSSLIESWVVEGFLKPIRGKSLEEVANEYLEDLIERNLILIRKRGDLGDITGCGVHDLLRDLCIRESLNEHFLSVPKSQHEIDFNVKGNYETRFLNPGGVKCARSKLIVGPRSTVLTGPLEGDLNPHLIRLCFHTERNDDEYYEKLPLYTKLWYLSLETVNTLGRSSLSTISQLWKLQTLCIHYEFNTKLALPSKIWEMPQLRRLFISNGFYLPIVTQIERTEDFIVLENLHTLVSLYDFRCTEDVVKRIPNRRNSKFNITAKGTGRTIVSTILPIYKLELNLVIIDWEDMISVIGSLPNLEIFHVSEGGDDEDPLRIAESTQFPKLEILELQYMISLKEIPRGFGEIETLRKIELLDCSSSAEDSAWEIWEQQQSFENEDFQLIINEQRYSIKKQEQRY
ncbi:hypothetical protein BUALT_Bualt07G0029600 [Buddleja alternifolia]|uniref:NB-ARC domain-containing protein n=1 Tax=Buddleja alternifolia TaxID=168488 RepID=A0AAV6XII2_9LAMI|nr:hypothetical protein BUALT_Bualt07G0029600 [Buddleja alternifolia]